jgi:seryl-tRNA synthetase
MLDTTLLRKDLDAVVAALQKRKNPQQFLDVAKFTALDAERKTIQVHTEELQAKRNTLSKSIGMLKAKGESTDAVMAEVATYKAELEAGELRTATIQAELNAMMMTLPNLPHESVPVGSDESGNVVARTWGTPKTFDFAVKDHVDIGTPLGLDADTGTKLSGSRFTLMRGPIARLHRARLHRVLHALCGERRYAAWHRAAAQV